MSKKQVDRLFKQERPVRDTVASERYGGAVYKFSDGSMIYIMGTEEGALWSSNDAFEKHLLKSEESKKETVVLDFIGWIESSDDINLLLDKSIIFPS